MYLPGDYPLDSEFLDGISKRKHFEQADPRQQDNMMKHIINAAYIMHGPLTLNKAGYKILSRPFGYGSPPDRFLDAYGFIDPSPSTFERNKNEARAMFCFSINLDDIQVQVEGEQYSGFDLWKLIYQDFLFGDIDEKTARELGLYPQKIYYYNPRGQEWMAQYLGAEIPDLELGFESGSWRISGGKLSTIYDSVKGENNFQRLASLDHAPLGCFDPENRRVIGLGRGTILGSSSKANDHEGPHRDILFLKGSSNGGEARRVSDDLYLPNGILIQK